MALAAEEPFLLRGSDFVTSWPGWGEWDLDYFVREYGSKEATGGKGDYPTKRTRFSDEEGEAANNTSIREPFSGVVERVRNDEPVYGSISLNYSERARLLDGLDAPPGMDDSPLIDCLHERSHGVVNTFLQELHWTQIFVGSEGTGMELHNDAVRAEIWTAQLTGEKQIVACSPTSQDAIYPGGDGVVGPVHPVNAFDPDVNIYSNFKDADCVWGALQPGELLHWPSTWFHQTKNTRGISLAVSAMAVRAPIADQLLSTIVEHSRLPVSAAGQSLPHVHACIEFLRDIDEWSKGSSCVRHFF